MPIKPGFYSIRQAGGDQDPSDGEAWGFAMLTHFQNIRLVGVDQGGCKISGSYQDSLDGGITMQIVYDLKCGSHLPGGRVLEADHRLEADIDIIANAVAGGHQLLDIGLGPMFISFEWLADPV